MTELELQEYHEHAFDAFCKRVIRNASVDALRASRRKQKTEMDIDDPMVAYILGVSPTSIARRKKSALMRLRDLMEVRSNDE